MDPQLSQDSLEGVLPVPSVSDPVTPEPPHAQLPGSSTKLHSNRTDNAAHMTPPPSTQVVPSSQRGKTRTPTPTMSHISTPPPTSEMPTQSQNNRVAGRFAGTMTAEEIASASAEQLRSRLAETQAALQEAKMSAAHHKLQYQMLSQESAAAVERMAVEAHMLKSENEVIQIAQQAKVAATPVQPSPFQEGMIPVQKDLYQRMCREIQELTEERKWLLENQAQKDKTILRQDVEIASLGDKVELMRERIKEYRDQAQHHNVRPIPRHEGASRSLHSMHNDSLRRGVASHEQPQPFAALLQASEMASQEARRPTNAKKGHVRNVQSTSSLPNTPQRTQRETQPYQTPSNRQTHAVLPSTAPQPRTSALRTPDVYKQQALPMSQHSMSGHLSDGTVSASEDEDSEAETDILEPDAVTESQASRTASQMLRNGQEDRRQKQASFEGRGMLEPSPAQSQMSAASSGSNMRQTKLFGAVRKAGVDRGGGGEPPAKRPRTIGLGIAGVRD